MLNFTPLLKRAFMASQIINGSYIQNSSTNWKLYFKPGFTPPFACLLDTSMCQALRWAAYNGPEVEFSSENVTEPALQSNHHYPPSIQPIFTEYLLHIRYHTEHQACNERLRPAVGKFAVYQGKQLFTERGHLCWGEFSGLFCQTDTGLARISHEKEDKPSTYK